MKNGFAVSIFLIMATLAFGQTQPGLYIGDNHQGNMGLMEIIEWLNFNVRNNGNYTIVLGKDETVPGISLRFNNMKVNITLKTTGTERKVSVNQSLALFIVGSGVTFTLEDNVALIGSGENSIVSVGNGGTFIMNGGIIRDSRTNGVSVSNGTFIMNNGTISGNKHAGVNGRDATLTMNGGTIKGNSRSGVSLYTCKFTMNDGVISGNSVTGKDSWGVNRAGGGVSLIWFSEFIMNNGTISENNSDANGGGIGLDAGNMANGSTFTMNGGTISGNTANGSGGGIYTVGSHIIIHKGTISENSAQWGAGIYCGRETLTIHDGTISKNKASSSGGGVYLGYASFIMNNGMISENYAQWGGGVFLSEGPDSGNKSTFTMNNGTISGNISNFGGGVYINNSRHSIFTMKNGTISGNSSANYGGGVFIENKGTFTKSGSGGIIFGSDAQDGQANTAKLGGQAVFFKGTGNRNITAGVNQILDTKQEGVAGGWED